MYNKRKIFFNGLLIMALILSIMASTKITVIFNIPIACSFFIFPLVYLSLVVLNELGGAKHAITSLISSAGILLLAYLSIMLILNLPNQVDTINQANAIKLLYSSENMINGLYVPQIKVVLGSVIGLLICGFSLIGIYTVTSKYTFKTMSCFLATLIGSLLFNGIYVVFTSLNVLESHDFTMLILNRFIFSVAFTVIVSILFLLFSYKSKKEEKLENTKTKKKLS